MTMAYSSFDDGGKRDDGDQSELRFSIILSMTSENPASQAFDHLTVGLRDHPPCTNCWSIVPRPCPSRCPTRETPHRVELSSLSSLSRIQGQPTVNSSILVRCASSNVVHEPGLTERPMPRSTFPFGFFLSAKKTDESRLVDRRACDGHHFP